MLDVKIEEPSDLWFALKNVNSPIPDPGLCPIWGWQMTLCRQHARRIVLKMIYKNKINRDHIHNRLSSDTQSFHISYSHLWIDCRKAHTINPSRLTMCFLEGLHWCPATLPCTQGGCYNTFRHTASPYFPMHELFWTGIATIWGIQVAKDHHFLFLTV